MKNRNIILVSDCFLLIFLGLVYGWSVFKKPLAAAYGWNDSQLTWTFTICMFMFCLGGFAGAKLASKIGHRNLAMISSVFIGASFVLMGFMTSLWQIYVLYGVVIGAVVGLLYNCVLATGNRWFPDKGGLVAGILLMFFGAGSLFLSPLSNYLITTLGLRKAFIVIGIMFFIVLFLCAFQVKVPTEEIKVDAKKQEIKDYTPNEMLRTRSFWIYMVWCIMVSSIGIGLLGQIATISGTVGMTDANCALMVSLFAVFNGLGRFFFGGFYDKRGRLLTMTIFGIFFTLGGLTLLLGVLKDIQALIIASFALSGIAYGGVTPTNANFARSFFGNKNYAMNFSLVNFNLLVTVFLGQFVGSTLYMRTGTYLATAIAVIILSVVSLVIQFFIKPVSE